MKTVLSAAIAMSALTAGSAAGAASISGNGNPASNAALSGGTQIDFTGQVNGDYASLNLTGVTITGVGGPVSIDNFWAGQYNTTGTFLDNNQGATDEILFTFANPVSAFGFNLGAHDVSWTLTAYAGATLLDTFTFGAIHGSNAGEYYGLSAGGITSARLTTANAASNDYILLDNFTFVSGSAVPEPSTWAMMLFGFGAVGVAMRRRKPVALAQIA